MITVRHSAGHCMLGPHPLTLSQAEALHSDIGADFMSAAKARDRAMRLDLPLDVMRARCEMDRLSALERALRRAIMECIGWRVAAGWSDPWAADLKLTGTEQ